MIRNAPVFIVILTALLFFSAPTPTSFLPRNYDNDGTFPVASASVNDRQQENGPPKPQQKQPRQQVQQQQRMIKSRWPIENVTWAGTQFFLPQGYKIYHPKELEEIFRDKPTLWVGDSTMRRAMLTFRFLLRDIYTRKQPLSHIEDSKYMNINKILRNNDGTINATTNHRNGEEELCDRYSNETVYPIAYEGITCWKVQNSINDFFGEPCLAPFLQFLQQHADVMRNYTVLIISLGLYDVLGRCEGSSFRDGSFTRRERIQYRLDRIPGLTQQLMELFHHQFPQITVIWRTMGFHRRLDRSLDHFIVNDATVSMIRSNYSNTNKRVADWGTAIMDRSFDLNRIAGDNHYHYGHQARILFIQMLANILDNSMVY